MPLPAKYSQDTALWIRCPSDEAAAKAGMVMDLERGNRVVEWIESNCCLYEGDKAGENIVLLSAWRDFVVRLFGWVRWSKKWQQWVRRYTRAAFWGAKKNGKSPMLAAIETYLFCGDGEQGQKVYIGALNGDQARITQQHAVQMILQSPSLADQCKINNTTLNIRHIPTNSQAIIITGDNARGQKAKEGLNGSVLFDEMHVVADEMWRRVNRAGISRKEPILLSVSTAGDDRNCIGYEWAKRGRDANANLPGREDLKFLHVEYTIPEDIQEIEIVNDPLKYLPLANPAWGEIIDPEEIVDDCKTSFASGGREWAKFMQYRANRWIGSVSRWLDTTAWQQSMDSFTLQDMRGRDCYIGIDLARRLDMVGVVFCFPYPEGDEDQDNPQCVRMWPMAWLNEETATHRDPIYGLLKWGREGYLNVTPGNTTDFSRVKHGIRKAVWDNQLNVKGIYFDKTYAEEFTQALVDGEETQNGELIARGFGCERYTVAQDIKTLTGPSCEFERRIKAQKIRHPGNPVFDWQIENVEAYTDVNQNVRPVKPEQHSGKSVDLILASVMSLLGCMTNEERGPRVWSLQ